MTVSDEEHERRMVFARELAAQAWCVPSTENIEMDPRLAEAFAAILVVEMYEANLGCATTRELITEITARVDNLDYKTVSDD